MHSNGGSAGTPTGSPCKRCSGSGRRPPAWSISPPSTSPPSSPVSAVLKRLLKLRASMLLPLSLHDPHIYGGGSDSDTSSSPAGTGGGRRSASLALLLRAGLALVFGVFTLLMSLQAVGRRRAIVYSSPTGARVTGSAAAAVRAGRGVMGLGDCIPADIMLGGRMGPSGDGKGMVASEGAWSGNTSSSIGGGRPIPMVATNLDFDTERCVHVCVFKTKGREGSTHPIFAQ